MKRKILIENIKYFCELLSNSIVGRDYVQENWCPHTCDYSINYEIQAEMPSELEKVIDDEKRV